MYEYVLAFRASEALMQCHALDSARHSASACVCFSDMFF